MKTKVLFAILGLSIVLSSYKPTTTKSYTINTTETTVTVSGTSTLHDWTSSVKKVDGTTSLALDESNLVASISSMTLNFYTTSFSSGKTTMDDKTTEALKATTYPKITFVLSQVTATKAISTKIQQITATGNLTIAGVTKYITASAYCTVTSTSEIYIQGTQSIDMTQYGVVPPTAMLGTLQTGKDISIVYNLFFK
jgi:polyisoprenoid-binding protein YceI